MRQKTPFFPIIGSLSISTFGNGFFFMADLIFLLGRRITRAKMLLGEREEYVNRVIFHLVSGLLHDQYPLERVLGRRPFHVHQRRKIASFWNPPTNLISQEEEKFLYIILMRRTRTLGCFSARTPCFCLSYLQSSPLSLSLLHFQRRVKKKTPPTADKKLRSLKAFLLRPPPPPPPPPPPKATFEVRVAKFSI